MMIDTGFFSERDRSALALAGMGIRTTNEGGRSLRDQAALWGEFAAGGFLGGAFARGGKIYGVYSDYEGDRTAPFRFAICAEPGPDVGAGGLEAFTVEAGRYAVFRSRRGPAAEVVGETWGRVWELESRGELGRAYRTDAEVYDAGELAAGSIELELWISIGT